VEVKPKYRFEDLVAKLALPFMTLLALFLGYSAFLIELQQIIIILIIFIGLSPCLPGIVHGALLHDGN
jgi:hypothetical protein